MSREVWDEIIDSFANFNGFAIVSQSVLVKGATDCRILPFNGDSGFVVATVAHL